MNTYHYRKCRCSRCGRKVLVETSMYGLPERSKAYVTCAECLVLSTDFKKDYPDEANEILNWIKEENRPCHE